MNIDKRKIVKSVTLTEVYLKNQPEIFKENKFELAEYALVNGYKKSFELIFNHFYPEIKILFEYGFERKNKELLNYDEYARRHRNYLKCYLPAKLKNKVYNE